jgi:hypothetical protein
MTGSETPSGGVASSQDVTDAIADVLMSEDRSFFSKGVRLPHPIRKGESLAARTNYVESESFEGGLFQVILGDFGNQHEVWTTPEGMESLIGDLMMALDHSRG